MKNKRRRLTGDLCPGCEGTGLNATNKKCYWCKGQGRIVGNQGRDPFMVNIEELAETFKGRRLK